MPRRHRRTMRGGFLDTLTNWGSSLTQGASSLWEKTKQATSSATSGLTSSAPAYSPTTSTQQMTTSTYGGRTKRRRMRGGFKDNTPTTGLAAHAASFSGETAKPHTMVGGRTRKHKKRGKRSHKSHKRH